MKLVTIHRVRTGDSGTFGRLTGPEFSCYTGELPWRNNMRGISCIPEGEYLCHERRSPKFGRVYEVTGIPGRALVLIHSGNFCGDTSKGFQSHVEGCVLLGRVFGRLSNKYGKMQEAVCASLPAVSAFNALMGFEDFTLRVEWDAAIKEQ